MTETIVSLDAQAVRASMYVVAKAGDADLARPTPCAGWTLADLLVHMTAQHHGFAAAAEGNGANPDRWRPARRDPATLVAGYATAAERVLAAFAVEGVIDRQFSLAELSTQVTFPGRQAIAFHFVDYVVHGWDVARSLGLGYDLEPGLLAAARRIALAVPDDEGRLRPGASFAPRIAAPPGATTLDQILALLGRRPEWPG